jgi:hypothetical protein
MKNYIDKYTIAWAAVLNKIYERGTLIRQAGRAFLPRAWWCGGKSGVIRATKFLQLATKSDFNAC